jgi:hypothetical protein
MGNQVVFIALGTIPRYLTSSRLVSEAVEKDSSSGVQHALLKASTLCLAETDLKGLF